MLRSTRLSMKMLDLTNRSSTYGLPSTIYTDRFGMIAGIDTASEQALAVIARISRVSESMQVPLPEAILMTMPSGEVMTDDGLPSTVANRSIQVLQRHNPVISALSVTGTHPLPGAPSSRVLPASKALSRILTPRQYSATDAITMTKRPLHSAATASQDRAISLSRSPVLAGVLGVTTGPRTSNVLPQRQRDALSSMMLSGERFADQADTSNINAGSPASTSILAKISKDLKNIIPGHIEQRVSETKREAQSTTVPGTVIGLNFPQSGLSDNRFTNDADHRSLLLASLPDYGSIKSLPGSTGASDIQPDLRQRAVPTRSTSALYRRQDRMAVPQHLTSSPGAGGIREANAHGGMRSPTPSQIINLMGAVMVDSRHLGRITASSQAREASLPARGPSRVNLRAVPIFSGMKIPS